MTTEDIQDRVDALLEEADKLDYGPERIAKCEEAVRLADEAKHDVAAYDARLGLIQAAVFGGWPEKGLVAFGWCVAKVDAEPERFRESRALAGFGMLGIDLLWVYKWMTLQVPWYPQLARKQIDETLDDMERRYRKHGLSLRPVHMNRTRVAQECDPDPAAAKAHYDKWQWALRDDYADCEACEISFRVDYLVERKEYERAFEVAKPLLSGAKKCAEVPHVTYGYLLAPARELGLDELAESFSSKGLALVEGQRDFVATTGQHVAHLVARGDLDRALELFERHLPFAVGNRIPKRVLDYYVVGRDLFTALADAGRDATLRAPKELGYRGDPKDLRAIATHFATEAKPIAAKFDARNGNDLVSRRAGFVG
ncbi:MAG: hypothetical protein KC586_23745 [Myxococcales bacterium]|nr:hypothetical protein [Myxococcales bacterium]